MCACSCSATAADHMSRAGCGCRARWRTVEDTRAFREGSRLAESDHRAPPNYAGKQVLRGADRILERRLVGHQVKLGNVQRLRETAPSQFAGGVRLRRALSMPASVTERKMNGATDAGNCKLSAIPQAATTPP